MRIPVKSEDDAFRVVWISLIAIVVVFVVGALTEPIIGVVLFAGVLLGALAWELKSRDPDRPRPLRDAADEASAEGGAGRRRVLVVANETVTGRELRAAIMEGASVHPEIRVVCPILPSRAHHIASDIDDELAEAHKRLERTLAWAAEQGLHATGHVSSDRPLVAICDQLRTFPADELIISTHPRKRSRWLESGLIERAREELDIPVRHVVVDLAAAGQPTPGAASRS